MKYQCNGHVSIDNVVFEDGSKSDTCFGGPVFYAYAGIKLWTDDCMLNARVGKDFYGHFEDWIAKSNGYRKGITVLPDSYCNYHIITYEEDGSYSMHSVHGDENMHTLDALPENFDVDEYCGDAKAIYIDRDADPPFFEAVYSIKKRRGFKIMWEITTHTLIPENYDRILKVLSLVDFVSLNVNEGKTFFAVDTQGEVVEKLKELPIEMIFLRAGTKGSITIVGDKDYFIPIVGVGNGIDATGCGNNSTATAMYAYCETGDPILTGIMANISAYFNAKQYGIHPSYTDEDRAEARVILEEYKKLYK